jgi:hypothetical protein
MSELQNEAIEPELDVSVENSNEEQPELVASDLAPDSEAEHESQPQELDEEAKRQEAINKRIGQKTFEAKQAQRERDEARAELERLQRAEQERQAAQYAEIPPMPDPFDDDYDAKVKARDSALLAKAQFDAQQATLAQQAKLRQEEAQRAKIAEFQQSVAAYSQKAVELDIKPEELQTAAKAVEQYGLSDDLVLHILGDSEGPLITKYLAANPLEGVELAQMSPYAVGVKLESIKEKAKVLKPKVTKAPPPSEKLEGSSAAPENYQHIKGASFS